MVDVLAPTATSSRLFRRPVLSLRSLAPGLILSIAAAGIAFVVNGLLPGVSPLVVGIVFGVLAANTIQLPKVMAPGIAFSAKRLLRLGIVFLGLKLALTDIVALGAPMLMVIVGIVAVGIFGTVLIGRMLRIPRGLTLLIACGFSICGAAAVASVAGTIDPGDEAEEDTVVAVALVVLFGTLMIPAIPLLARVLGLSPEVSGMWAGGAIHEVAQVVAAGGLMGGVALSVAVVVKLGRVLLLAPIVLILGIRQRRLAYSAGVRKRHGSAVRLPPIVPLFVVGFLAMVLLRSFVSLPDVVLTSGDILQTVLLAAAMFALGCGVKLRTLAKVGLRPFVLAGLATVLVTAVAYAGVVLLG